MASVRQVLGDELTVLASKVQRLAGTGHALLETASDYVLGRGHDMHVRGLIVLLMGMTVRGQEEGAAAMLDRSREKRMAEIIEMIHAACLLHDDIASHRPGAPQLPLALSAPLALGA
jgi:geranylgeranyl pyrophosphate synthase